MQMRQLCYVVIAAILVLPLTAGAEIYKWKDKDGAVKYSDTPPPANIKQEAIGKKKASKPVEPPVDANAAPAPAGATPAAEGKKPGAKQVTDPAVDAAKLRQRDAEIERNNKQQREAEAKQKAENCRAARANYENYAQGGRVYKMNEKGEREYLDTKALKEGVGKSQAEINQYCN